MWAYYGTGGYYCISDRCGIDDHYGTDDRYGMGDHYGILLAEFVFCVFLLFWLSFRFWGKQRPPPQRPIVQGSAIQPWHH
jgi:hypothetical protein